jgi:hypothetical protein
VQLWQVETGKKGPSVRVSGGGPFTLAFSPDGGTLASGSGVWDPRNGGGYVAGAVQLWDPATGQQRGGFQGGTGEVTALAFSPDGRTLGWAGPDGLVRLNSLGAAPLP